MSDTFGMLQELLEQDQFELPDPEEAERTGRRIFCLSGRETVW